MRGEVRVETSSDALAVYGIHRARGRVSFQSRRSRVRVTERERDVADVPRRRRDGEGTTPTLGFAVERGFAAVDRVVFVLVEGFEFARPRVARTPRREPRSKRREERVETFGSRGERRASSRERSFLRGFLRGHLRGVRVRFVAQPPRSSRLRRFFPGVSRAGALRVRASRRRRSEFFAGQPESRARETRRDGARRVLAESLLRRGERARRQTPRRVREVRERRRHRSRHLVRLPRDLAAVFRLLVGARDDPRRVSGAGRRLRRERRGGARVPRRRALGANRLRHHLPAMMPAVERAGTFRLRGTHRRGRRASQDPRHLRRRQRGRLEDARRRGRAGSHRGDDGSHRGVVAIVAIVAVVARGEDETDGEGGGLREPREVRAVVDGKADGGVVGGPLSRVQAGDGGGGVGGVGGDAGALDGVDDDEDAAEHGGVLEERGERAGEVGGVRGHGLADVESALEREAGLLQEVGDVLGEALVREGVREDERRGGARARGAGGGGGVEGGVRDARPVVGRPLGRRLGRRRVGRRAKARHERRELGGLPGTLRAGQHERVRGAERGDVRVESRLHVVPSRATVSRERARVHGQAGLEHVGPTRLQRSLLEPQRARHGTLRRRGRPRRPVVRHVHLAGGDARLDQLCHPRSRCRASKSRRSS